MELVHIPVNEVHADPTQPRTMYDEEVLQELAVSIKSHGVIEPALARRKDGRYILVFGHRRHKASIIAGMQTMPCMVRDLTDEEALELQLIENSQRENVHPMDEAAAIQRYIGLKHMNVQEVAAKWGKKEYYIRQRLKLNSLTLDWQKVFFRNLISIKDALSIAQLPQEAQSQLYNKQVDADDGAANEKISITDWMLGQYKGKLANAAFDLNDPTLIPHAGACSRCVFNTSVSKLFPEEEQNARCNNLVCYQNKTKVNLERKLAEAIDDPLMLLVDDSGALEAPVAHKIKKAEAPVLKAGQEYTRVFEPVKKSFENFKEEITRYQTITPEALETKYADYVHEREKEMEKYNNNIAQGKYVKALVVAGDKAGKVTYVELLKKGTAKEAAAAIKNGEATQADIKAEMERLVEKETRSQELDHVKVHDQVKEALKTHEPFTQNVAAFEEVEIIAIILALREYCMPVRQMLENKYSINSFSADTKLHNKLQQLDYASLMEIYRNASRLFIANTLITGAEQNPEKSNEAAAVRGVAQLYIPDIVKTWDEQQAAVAVKRIAKVNKRVEELEAQLAVMQAKAAEAKPAKKQKPSPAAKPDRIK